METQIIDEILEELQIEKTKEILNLIEYIVNICCDVVYESDPSSKMIVHSPYKEIVYNIKECFGYLEG